MIRGFGCGRRSVESKLARNLEQELCPVREGHLAMNINQIFHFMETVVVSRDFIGIIAAAILAIPRYWPWVRKMTAQPILKIGQIAAVAVLVGTLMWDGADRLGAFGPTNADLQQKIAALEAKRAHLQGESDYRRIVIQDKDGHGGLLADIYGPNGYKARLKAAEDKVAQYRSPARHSRVSQPASKQGQLTVGCDSVAYGNVTGSIGSGSVVIGPTDSHGNTEITKPQIVGHNAHGGPSDIVFGANAGSGGGTPPSGPPPDCPK